MRNVNTHPTAIYSREQWLKKPFLCQPYHAQLIDNGSLTVYLQQRYDDFQVKFVRSFQEKAISEEAKLLGFKTCQHVLIREVILVGNRKPVIYAHSVLPLTSLRGEWLGLRYLGNKPLGAALFANPKVKRTPLTFKKLSRYHPLYKHAAKHLVHQPEFLWARRSIFSLNCAKILVTEIF
jgi:chorismate--pyruvate lyase